MDDPMSKSSVYGLASASMQKAEPATLFFSVHSHRAVPPLPKHPSMGNIDTLLWWAKIHEGVSNGVKLGQTEAQ